MNASYYATAYNPCELNCVPRGENFFYRHKPAVVDGTKCYVGRTDICVDGVCRVGMELVIVGCCRCSQLGGSGISNFKMLLQLLVDGDFMGLDEDASSAPPAAAVVVAPHPRDIKTYYYKTGVYGECSATCNGGMRYRSVECWVLDRRNPRAVEESRCITQRVVRPQSQEACNMHRCVHAEYSVSSFGAVSDG